MDKATFHNPHQFPIGIEYVILNGQIIIKNGEHTEVRAGKIL
jgi:N-acyl-D-amino-acid deacylase